MLWLCPHVTSAHWQSTCFCLYFLHSIAIFSIRVSGHLLYHYGNVANKKWCYGEKLFDCVCFYFLFSQILIANNHCLIMVAQLFTCGYRDCCSGRWAKKWNWIINDMEKEQNLIHVFVLLEVTESWLHLIDSNKMFSVMVKYACDNFCLLQWNKTCSYNREPGEEACKGADANNHQYHNTSCYQKS